MPCVPSRAARVSVRRPRCRSSHQTVFQGSHGRAAAIGRAVRHSDLRGARLAKGDLLLIVRAGLLHTVRGTVALPAGARPSRAGGARRPASGLARDRAQGGGGALRGPHCARCRGPGYRSNRAQCHLGGRAGARARCAEGAPHGTRGSPVGGGKGAQRVSRRGNAVHPDTLDDARWQKQQQREQEVADVARRPDRLVAVHGGIYALSDAGAVAQCDRSLQSNHAATTDTCACTLARWRCRLRRPARRDTVWQHAISIVASGACAVAPGYTSE